MKKLTAAEVAAVRQWLEQQFDVLAAKSSRKTLARDCSDGVLPAQLLKHLYPKLVELHNYPARNAFTLKLDNWTTLDRKVLRKLGLQQTPEQLVELSGGGGSGGGSGVAIERLCYEIMTKYQADERAARMLCGGGGRHGSGDGDETSQNPDIMFVRVAHKSGNGSVQQVDQKMVTYALYEQSQTTLAEQKLVISVLQQKIEHLDNLLKLKCQRIDDLLGQLARKSCRLKMESELFNPTSNRAKSPATMEVHSMRDNGAAGAAGDGEDVLKVTSTRSTIF